MYKNLLSHSLFLLALLAVFGCDEQALDEPHIQASDATCAVEGGDVPCNVLLEIGRETLLKIRGEELPTGDDTSPEFRLHGLCLAHFSVSTCIELAMFACGAPGGFHCDWDGCGC